MYAGVFPIQHLWLSCIAKQLNGFPTQSFWYCRRGDSMLLMLESFQPIFLIKWNKLIEDVIQFYWCLTFSRIFSSNGMNSGDKLQIIETEVNLGDFCQKDMSSRQFFRQEVRETWSFETDGLRDAVTPFIKNASSLHWPQIAKRKLPEGLIRFWGTLEIRRPYYDQSALEFITDSNILEVSAFTKLL